MTESDYLANITVEQLEEVLEKSNDLKEPLKYIDYLLGLPNDMKVLLITRGLMYMCIEREFDFEGDDIWEACAFYNSVVNNDDDPAGLGYYS